MAAQRILVTGASGFVGQHLVQALADAGYQVRAAARQPIVFENPRVEGVALGDMSRSFAAEYVVKGCDAIIHAAGMAHSRADIPDSAYTAINVDATRQMAKAAKLARVKRFVLMSSIRAQVGPAHAGVVTEDTPFAPTDAYGRSKEQAETVVSDVLSGSATKWTVLRPVLVYGPGVKGNMAALMRLAALPVPLPFGGLTGRRSLLSVGNLIGVLRHVLTSEATENGAFIAADSGSVTVADIFRACRQGLGKRPVLLTVPQAAVAHALKAAGKGELAERLTGNLVVDAARLRATGWEPAERTVEALADAARAQACH